jgi:hypothetical protein
MAVSLPQAAVGASVAFRQAVEDAGNAVDSMMMQYGWQMPGANGQYSTTAAGDAFDPNNVLSFDDQGKAVQTAPTGMGQYGTTGLFAESAQQTAAEEAEARLAARTSGITGGLARQRERLSETLGAQRMGGLSAQLFGGLGQQYADVGRSYLDVLTGRAQDEAGVAMGLAEEQPLMGEAPTPPVVAEPTAPTATSPYTTSRGGFAQASTGGRYQMGPQERQKYTKRATNQQLAAGGVPAAGGKPGQIFTGKGGTNYVRRSDGWYILG